MNQDLIKQYASEHPRRDVAVVGLRDKDGNVLLMRTHKLPDLWQPIGGGIESEDKSPKDAALRELKEEFGLVLGADALKAVLTTPYDFGEGTVYFFEAKIDRENLQFNIDPEEVIDQQWFSIEDSVVLPAMPATQRYLKQMK